MAYPIEIAIFDEEISADIIKEKLEKLFKNNKDFVIFEPNIHILTEKTESIHARMSLKDSGFNIVIVGYHYIAMKVSESTVKYIKQLEEKGEFQVFYQNDASWLSFEENISTLVYEHRAFIEKDFLNNEIEESVMEELMKEEEEEEVSEEIPPETEIINDLTEEEVIHDDITVLEREVEILMENESEQFAEEDADESINPNIDYDKSFSEKLDSLFPISDQEANFMIPPEEKKQESKENKLWEIFKKEKSKSDYAEEKPLIQEEIQEEKKEHKVLISSEEIIEKTTKENAFRENTEVPLYNEFQAEEEEEQIESEGEESTEYKEVQVPESKTSLRTGFSFSMESLSGLGSLITRKEKRSLPIIKADSDNIDIGFIGNLSGVGTSHIALTVANYFAGANKKVNFIDMKGDIYPILREQNYKFSIFSREDYGEAYRQGGIRIFDFGVLDLNNKKELIDFERCHIKYVVGNLSDLKGSGLNKNMQYMEQTQFYSVFNYTNNQELVELQDEFKELDIVTFPFSLSLENFDSNIFETF